jgi:hypothetical protein
MALRFIDGFDYYTTADAGQKWAVLASGGTVVNAGSRTGNGCFKITSQSNGLCRTFEQQDTWIAGFAINPAAAAVNTSFCSFRYGSNLSPHVSLVMAADGTVQARRGLGNGTLLGATTAKLSAGAWNYVEVKVYFHDTTGSVTINMDGSQALLLTNVDTLADSTYPGATMFVFNYDNSTSSRTILYDDVYICDGTGTTNDSFLGNVKVTTLFPSANGTNSGFTPSTGTDHSAVVDDITPDTSDYVSSPTPGAIDTWAYGDMPGSPGIFGAQLNTLAGKDDAGIRAYCPVARTGGTEYEGNSNYIGMGGTFASQLYELNPATSAVWTGADINAAEFGVKVKV